MKVCYHPAESGYRPRNSLFHGRFVPCPETPERTAAILAALRGDPRFELESPPSLTPEALLGVHAADYLDTLDAVCRRLKPGEELFPSVFRRTATLLRSPYPRIRAGYYALDNSTPLLPRSYDTALGAAATALGAAETIRAGAPAVYALARPPGHHAGRDYYAGYCLINNAALAAEALLDLGKVAILDVDFHHGNGSQDIFYNRADVLYVSLHCRPEEAYPYISGAADERGEGAGRGCTCNLPLPAGTAWREYEPALEQALEEVARFGAPALVVSLGFDTLEGDPIASFCFRPEDFETLGRMIRRLDRPTLVVQEGGYLVPALGEAALRFFDGLLAKSPGPAKPSS